MVLKDNHADETIVNLTADAKIFFKFVIKVMDSIRFRLEGDNYNDAESFTAASAKMEANQQVLLWPDVVFAVAKQ